MASDSLHDNATAAEAVEGSAAATETLDMAAKPDPPADGDHDPEMAAAASSVVDAATASTSFAASQYHISSDDAAEANAMPAQGVTNAATALLDATPDVASAALQSSPGLSPGTVDVKSQPQYSPSGAIFPTDHDVLAGRGASINIHRGNQHFRALCFQRKLEFDAGNHTTKRRIATEIVEMVRSLDPPGRFLKRQWDGTLKKGGAGGERSNKGPWLELSKEKCILKACQVMRDFQRPDRVAFKEWAAAERIASGGARKRRKTSTEGQQEMVGTAVDASAAVLVESVENDIVAGINDVLSGRGAFVNAHPGNQRLRTLATERKDAFDRGNYADKRTLAAEIVRLIRGQSPPGRFLRRKDSATAKVHGFQLKPRGLEGPWEELSDEKSVHKACQVMRDLKRPDRTVDRGGLSGTVPPKEEIALEAAEVPTIEVSSEVRVRPESEALTAADNAAVMYDTVAEHNAVAAAAAVNQHAPHANAEDDVAVAAAAAAATVEALDGALNVGAVAAPTEVTKAQDMGERAEV